MTSILANGQAAGTIGMIVWLVVLFSVMYFLMIRPQKKEQQKKELMLSEVAVGDTVLDESTVLVTENVSEKLDDSAKSDMQKKVEELKLSVETIYLGKDKYKVII